MSVANPPLNRLLSPIEPDAFFRETWERRPLEICGRRPDHYGDLLALRDIDEVLAFARPGFVYPDGSEKSTYIRGLPPGAPGSTTGAALGIAQVRQAFEQGKSIVVMGMQERRPAVADLCRGLEATFGCPVHANMYLTPQGSQGFAPHFDSHEVFVLQLEGSKRWRLFGASRALPLTGDQAESRPRPGVTPQEIELQPGDLLYIPRGHVHEAFASDDASLHLTIGMNVYRWVELLHHALALAAADDVRFRESLSGGALAADRPDARERFGKLFESLAADARTGKLFARAARALGDQFFARLSMLPCGQFAAKSEIERLALESIVKRNPQALCRVVEDGLEAAIEFPGNRVAGPQRIASALHFVAATPQFAVRDLPDDLSPDAKLVLVRRLCREGLLRPVEETCSENDLRMDRRQPFQVASEDAGAPFGRPAPGERAIAEL